MTIEKEINQNVHLVSIFHVMIRIKGFSYFSAMNETMTSMCSSETHSIFIDSILVWIWVIKIIEKGYTNYSTYVVFECNK